MKPDDRPAEPLDQPRGRRRGPAGRDHVVDDEHLLARARSRRGGSRAGRCRTRARTPRARSPTAACPALRTGHEPGAAAGRPRGAANTKPRASIPMHLVDLLVGERRGQRVDRERERVGRGEQRRDVAEDDARLGPVGNVAHELPQRGGVSHTPGVPPCARPALDRRATRAAPGLRTAPATCACGRVAGAAGAGSCAPTAGGPGTPTPTSARRVEPSTLVAVGVDGVGRRPTRRPPTRSPRPRPRRATPAPRAAPLGQRPVLRLALLPPRQERRRDEDRRVRTDEQTGREREREVLERRSRRRSRSRRPAATAPACSATNDVDSERISTG